MLSQAAHFGAPGWQMQEIDSWLTLLRNASKHEMRCINEGSRMQRNAALATRPNIRVLARTTLPRETLPTSCLPPALTRRPLLGSPTYANLTALFDMKNLGSNKLATPLQQRTLLYCSPVEEYLY